MQWKSKIDHIHSCNICLNWIALSMAEPSKCTGLYYSKDRNLITANKKLTDIENEVKEKRNSDISSYWEINKDHLKGIF